MVLTLILEPKEAWAMLMGTVTSRSKPSLRKNRCALTLKVMTRSPGIPPNEPLSPCPVRRTLDPLSTPRGTVTWIFRF